MTDAPSTPRVSTDWNPTEHPDRSAQHAFYREAQRRPPMWSDLVGAWVVTRAEDVVTVSEDPETFSNAVAVPPLDKVLPPEVLRILARGGAPGRHMLQAEPADHQQMRVIGEKVVHGPRINRSIPSMYAAAEKLLDLAGSGEIELVSQYSSPFVHRVLNGLIGIPETDMPMVDDYNNAFLGLMAPSTPLETKKLLAERMLDYDAYLDELIADRRRERREDMTSALIDANVELGIDLDEALPDMRMFLRGLWAGGIHTTKDAITSAVWTFLSQDGRAPWCEAVARPRRISTLFEEVLRLEAPHRGLTRLATRATTLAGVEISAGEQVMLLYGAANLDPGLYEAPTQYRPDRDNTKAHFAFGNGIHRCLGRALARTEGRVALETITRRHPGLRLADDWDPVWGPEFYFHGLEHLRVRT